MKKSNKHVNFLCKTAAFVLLIILTSFLLTACLEKGDSTGNPELTPYSPEIYVSGEWLYYDGPRCDAGLFAYNLETGEKVKITEQQGTPLKTSHGFYYSVGMKVYEINGLSLELLCVIPKNAELVDYVQGKVYWIAGRGGLYSGDVDSKGMVSDGSVQVLYCSTEEENPAIRWAKISDDGAYIGERDGLYFVDFETLEAECIWNGRISSAFYQSFEGEYLFVQSLEGDNYENSTLYIVSAEGIMQKIDEVRADFALVHDGTVYYDGSGILAYDLEDGSKRELGAGAWSCAAAFYDHYIILRHGDLYGIGLFDILDGTLKWI